MRLRLPDQPGQTRCVSVGLRQVVVTVDQDNPLQAAPGGNQIVSPFVDGAKHAEDGGLRRPIPEFDVVLRAVVQTTFGSDKVSLIEKTLAHLAVGDSKTLLIADDTMGLERSVVVGDRVFPVLLPRLFHSEVVIEDAQRLMVVHRLEEIEGFEIVGAGFLRSSGADVQIAQIDERVGNCLLVSVDSLQVEHFPVAGFRSLKLTCHSAHVAEVAERLREGHGVLGGPVVRNRLFISRLGLLELAPVEENTGTMFVDVSQGILLMPFRRAG